MEEIMSFRKYHVNLVQEAEYTYQALDKIVIDKPESLIETMRILGSYSWAEERFYVLFLDTKLSLIGVQEVSRGTLDQTSVHPREVFKAAILANASSIAIAHNHPSGETWPSKEDLAVTARLFEAGKLLGIDVVDHIITGGFGSAPTLFRENSLIS